MQRRLGILPDQTEAVTRQRVATIVASMPGEPTMRTGKYYEEGRGRARKVQELFSRIAPRYDLINDLQSLGMHRIWKRRLVRLAEPPDDGALLDLCCGTGDILRALARMHPRAGRLVGLDFAQPMLAIAAQRARTAGPDLQFVRGDALALPFPDASFDRVTISYGLRNVADVDRCMTEARRVLRPGGRFLILEFGKPDHPLVARAYFAYLRVAVPLFGWIFFRDPDTHGYILDSLLRFPSQDELAERLRANGFARARVEKPALGTMGILIAEA